MPDLSKKTNTPCVFLIIFTMFVLQIAIIKVLTLFFKILWKDSQLCINGRWLWKDLLFADGGKGSWLGADVVDN